MANPKIRFLVIALAAGAATVGLAQVGGRPAAQVPLPTTLEDFFQGGSQPDAPYEQFLSSYNCGFCHGTFDPDVQILKPWAGSMMAQAARDPLFYACLTVANQDAPFSGDLCIRCHAPRAWLSGRSEPPNGSEINASDRDSVNCHFCHRLLDPFYKRGVSPREDKELLDGLTDRPVALGGGNYVADLFDRRRGWRDDTQPPHSKLVSPFHAAADVCATCHDVSNPVYERQPDDTYLPTPFDQRHPTDHKYDQFPLERTYSEWLMSEFARGGVDMGGRFGGNKRVVSTCADCHMPDVDSKTCNFPEVPLRSDMARHELAGGNAWVQDMVKNLYPDEVNAEDLDAGKAAAVSMLQRAATLEVVQSGDALAVRVTNETGHKLPSGYPEGRRIWLNVQFRDARGDLIAERGAYNAETAELAANDTKVYETELGLSEEVAQLVGLPSGKSFHFALNNVVLKDNRIPPRGFANAAFREVQAPVVAAGYSDGQYWDDTEFGLPTEAVEATVRLYYQTANREYIEFLRDANVTDNRGQVLFEQWELTGKSPPVEMASVVVALDPFRVGDFNGDRVLDLLDYAAFAACLEGPGVDPVDPQCQPADLDADDDVDVADFARFQRRFGPQE